MRRLYPAILIIISVCLLYYIFDITLEKQINNVLNTVNEIDELIISDEYEKAEAESKNLKKLWEKVKKTAGFLIDEKKIENAGYYIQGLSNTIFHKNKNEYLIFSDSVKYYTRNLQPQRHILSTMLLANI